MSKLTQETVKYVQETCQEVKEMCQGVKNIWMNVSLDTGNDSSALENVLVVGAKPSIFPVKQEISAISCKCSQGYRKPW